MSSYEEIINATIYSYNSATIITWTILAFGLFKTIHSFILAYKDNKTYQDMQKNKDKTGITQFYYGVILSVSCVIIFFLPYLINYKG